MARIESGTTLTRPPLRRPAERAERIPALTVLAHPDLARAGDRALAGELAAGRPAELSRLVPHFAPPGETAARGRPLGDRYLSRRPLVLAPEAGGGVTIERGEVAGPVAVDGEPLAERTELPADRLETGVTIELCGRVALLLHRIARPPEPVPPAYGLIGDSDALLAVRRAIQRVADLEVPVLLRGETGTGKELVSRALHDAGPRRTGPFVAVNLGALPPALAASELFGVARGAFTGADRDRPGWFQRADGGTLLLDEVGEAIAEVQVMLLRALESGEVTAVGGRAPRRLDVRLLAATDAGLEERIAAGAFRAPLFHRLAAHAIHLPPLRERPDDVARLLAAFLRREQLATGSPVPPADDGEPWLAPELAVRLVRHPWPGNVRQLANAARELVIANRGRATLAASPGLEALLAVPAAGSGGGAGSSGGAAPARPEPPRANARETRRRPASVTAEELTAALDAHGGDLKAAAAALGIARPSLYDLIARSPVLRTAAAVPAGELRRAHAKHRGDLAATAAALRVSRRGLQRRLRDLGLE
jgi:two-component system nitrogen regulation response regulator GlnG